MTAESRSLYQRVVHFFDRGLWTPQQTARASLDAAQRALQLVVIVVDGIVEDLILLRASALTYYSVLAMVPLLAIVVAVVGAIGIGEDMIGVLIEQVAVGSPEAGARITELVKSVDFGALGTIGAAMLFATTILGLSSIERSLNRIWGVARERSWERRIPDYLAVLIVAPLVLGVAISLGTTLRSDALVTRLLENPLFAVVYEAGLQQAPLVFLWLGFSFLYWFLPNTRVQVVPAVLGGAVAALLFTLAQWGYVRFNVGVARSNAVFGGFAALPLLFVWIYVSWVIVLLGAEVGYAYQNLDRLRRSRRGLEPSPAEREALGIEVAARIARAFREEGAALQEVALADDLGIAPRHVQALLHDLQRAGIVAPRDEDGHYQLGRAAERIRLLDLLAALRGQRQGPELEPEVRELLAKLDQQTAAALGGVTLADLVDTPSS
jgi:membrane protein